MRASVVPYSFLYCTVDDDVTQPWRYFANEKEQLLILYTSARAACPVIPIYIFVSLFNVLCIIYYMRTYFYRAFSPFAIRPK